MHQLAQSHQKFNELLNSVEMANKNQQEHQFLQIEAFTTLSSEEKQQQSSKQWYPGQHLDINLCRVESTQISWMHILHDDLGPIKQTNSSL